MWIIMGSEKWISYRWFYQTNTVAVRGENVSPIRNLFGELPELIFSLEILLEEVIYEKI